MRFYPIIFISFCFLSIFSCKNEADKIEKELIGVWVLDSISSPRSLIDGISSSSYGNFYESSEHEKITFNKNNQYLEEWMQGDVGHTFKGRYFVLNNPNRKLRTLSFIPDIQISDKDTIRIEYKIFDIVKLDIDRLQVVEQTTFIDREGLPSIIFNKNNIYKRIQE